MRCLKSADSKAEIRRSSSARFGWNLCIGAVRVSSAGQCPRTPTVGARIAPKRWALSAGAPPRTPSPPLHGSVLLRRSCAAGVRTSRIASARSVPLGDTGEPSFARRAPALNDGSSPAQSERGQPAGNYQANSDHAPIGASQVDALHCTQREGGEGSRRRLLKRARGGDPRPSGARERSEGLRPSERSRRRESSSPYRIDTKFREPNTRYCAGSRI